MNRPKGTCRHEEGPSTEDLAYVQAFLFVIASIIFFAGSSIGFVVAARRLKTKRSSSK